MSYSAASLYLAASSGCKYWNYNQLYIYMYTADFNPKLLDTENKDGCLENLNKLATFNFQYGTASSKEEDNNTSYIYVPYLLQLCCTAIQIKV